MRESIRECLTGVISVQGQSVAASAHRRPSPCQRRRAGGVLPPGGPHASRFSHSISSPAAVSGSIPIRKGGGGVLVSNVFFRGQCMIIVLMRVNLALRFHPAVNLLLMLQSISHRSFLCCIQIKKQEPFQPSASALEPPQRRISQQHGGVQPNAHL